MLCPGDDAIDFTADSTDGLFTLSERVKEGPVLLYFYVINYGRTCTDYITQLNERSEDLSRLGIRMFQVNNDSVENHRDWMRHTASEYDIISDTDCKISRSYDCTVRKAKSEKIIGNPNRGFFLIGMDMKVLYTWQADMPMDTLLPDILICESEKALD